MVFLLYNKSYLEMRRTTLSTNSLLQLLDLDVMMEVVEVAVAKPQINVELAKETVTRILTAKMVLNVEKIIVILPLVFPEIMTAAMTLTQVILPS